MNHWYMQQDVWIADSMLSKSFQTQRIYVLYDSIYMKSKNRQNHVMVIEIKTAVIALCMGGE